MASLNRCSSICRHRWAELQGPHWEVVRSCPAPHPGGCHLLSSSLSPFLCPCALLSDTKSLLLSLCPSLCVSPLWPSHCTAILQPQPTAGPHQPCPRKPRWVGAGCSHSDWQAGALAGSRRHTQTGSRTYTPCPRKGSPAGSGAGGSVLGNENSGAGLRRGHSPHASTQPTQEHTPCST